MASSTSLTQPALLLLALTAARFLHSHARVIEQGKVASIALKPTGLPSLNLCHSHDKVLSPVTFVAWWTARTHFGVIITMTVTFRKQLAPHYEPHLQLSLLLTRTPRTDDCLPSRPLFLRTYK